MSTRQRPGQKIKLQTLEEMLVVRKLIGYTN